MIINDDTEYHFPDSEEVSGTMSFLSICQEKDLIESWNRISQEWDPKSVVAIHKFLCNSGRISEIVENYTKTSSP